jgi:hypothetical protein
MAKGDGEHNMLFDLRSGRRRNVIKVVYATLAVLMGLSLFLVIGGFNIAELFTGSGSTDAAEVFEDDAERIEAKLQQEPENPQLLLNLTRTRINAGNSLYGGEPGAEVRTVTPEAVQQLRLAADAWERYLGVTDKPSASGALLMAPTMLVLAENARSTQESDENAEAAAEAASIVADQRPNLNSLSTYAIYTALLAEKEKAEAIAEKAKKYTTEKTVKEAIDKEVARNLQLGENFEKARKEVEQIEAEGGSAAGRQDLENPLGGAGLGGASLGE